jgi:hypothetical protein
MRIAFSQVHSATATERFASGDVATVQYKSPNRYSITMPAAQIVLTGNTEYAKRTGGQWAQSPRGPEDQAMLQAVWQLAGPPEIDIHKLYKIASIGTKTIDGTPVRGYRLHDMNGAYDETIWIGSNDLPVAARIEMSGKLIDIHYTGYNASTLIATPNQ